MLGWNTDAAETYRVCPFCSIFVQESFNVTILLKTGVPGFESFVSAQK